MSWHPRDLVIGARHMSISFGIVTYAGIAHNGLHHFQTIHGDRWRATDQLDGFLKPKVAVAQPIPAVAGYKDKTVSKDNAEALAASSVTGRLRIQVRNLYRNGFEGTADEAAERLGETPFAIRPRCTELRTAGELERVAIKRNESGKSAWSLRATKQASEAAA